MRRKRRPIRDHDAMAGGAQAIYRVFGAEIDRLRALLRDLEPGDVPAKLRRVVDYAGGRRLPPPLLKSLIVEIDRNEWLRNRLREEAGDDASEALVQLLDHEPGWWLALVENAGDTAPPGSDATAQAAMLQQKLDEARRRNADLRSSLERVETELRGMKSAARQAEELASARHEISHLQREVDEAVEARERAEAAADAADERIAAILRRDRRRGHAPMASGAPVRGGGVGDPLEAARRLDRASAGFAAAVAARTREPDPVPATDPILAPEPVALPAGLAPDRVGAIEWLLADAPALPVIVDGYNLTYLIDAGSFTAAETRHRLVSELDRFVRRAKPDHRVSVFFDSSIDDSSKEEGFGGGQMSQGGVEVVFATASDTADDAIVEEVEALAGRAVVITNDRELRERSSDEGALVLWGAALAQWMGV
jgi:predicted RNA-binding protein with PIN domain